MAITTLNNRAINRSDTAASGQFWTATSATASDFQAGGGAWTLISTTSISSATSFSVTSGIDSTYDVYKVLFSGVQFDTDDRTHKMQLYVSASLVTASDYKYSIARHNSAGSNAQPVSAGGDHIQINGDSNEADVDSPWDHEMTIYGPATSSQFTQVTFQGLNILHGGAINTYTGGGILENTGAVTGFKIYNAGSGNYTAGKIRLYGISNS